MLDQLELKQAVSALDLPPTKKTIQKSKAKPIQPSGSKRKRESAAAEDTGPRRASARLRGVGTVDPNETPAQKRQREAEVEEKRAMEAEAALEAAERARIQKRPRHHDMKLENLIDPVVDAEVQELSTLNEAFKALADAPVAKRVGDPEAYVFEDKEAQKEQRELELLRERMANLKVVSRAKVTQDRIYSAAYHPEPTKDLIFFGGPRQSLVLQVSSLTYMI